MKTASFANGLLVTLVIALGASSSAHAQHAARTSALAWVRLPGAEGCASGQELARAVEQRLGRAVFVGAGEAELAIEGRAERVDAPSGFRAVVRIADASGAVLGERTLDQSGDECAALLAPLALAIAVMIDPDAAMGPREADAPEEEAPDAPVETRVVTEVVTERIVERVEVERVEVERVEVERVEVEVPGPRWRLEIALSPQVALGLLPFVAPGAGLALFLTPPGFVPIVLRGALYPWSRAELADGWVDHLVALAGLGICPLALREDRVSFLACAGVDAGAQVVIGHEGASVPAERERVIVQLDVGARLHVRLVGPLMFHVGAALLVPFRTEPWLAVGDGVQHRPEPIAGVLDLGLGVDLDL